jgi:hypothetical protein
VDADVAEETEALGGEVDGDLVVNAAVVLFKDKVADAVDPPTTSRPSPSRQMNHNLLAEDGIRLLMQCPFLLLRSAVKADMGVERSSEDEGR